MGFWTRKGVVVIMIGILFNTGSGQVSGIRYPAVSGSWYPDSKSQLAAEVDRYLSQAHPPELHGKLLGFIAPHAGFVYSGPVAAYSYKTVQGESFDVVILVGNSHHFRFTGAALDDSEFYRTPLGDVPVDLDMVRKLESPKHQVVIDTRIHQPEHSLEAQIPFLQRTLKPGYRIVPILFGFHADTAVDFLVKKIPDLIKNRKALIIASTDLTHYPTYEMSCSIDEKTVQAIASLDVSALERVETHEMSQGLPNLSCVLCGSTAVKTVMRICKRLGADKGVVLHRANSGDVPIGSKDRVVGYGAVAFLESSEGITDSADDSGKTLRVKDKKYLLGLSRYVLEQYVKTGKKPELSSPKQYEIKRGGFVTLHENGRLRGCIGYILPIKSLFETVVENTINACAKDPRFPRVTQDELDRISIEISVLTPPKHVPSYKDIIIGKHGVVLKKGFYQAVFLPQVAPEQGWNLEEMLRHLALKAGLPADGWQKGATFEVFEAEVFSEDELGRQPFSP